MSRALAGLAVGLLLTALVACGPSTTPPPSGGSTPPGPGASPSTVAGGSAGPSATATTEAPFDPASVKLRLEQIARVPGGPLAIVAPHDGSGRLFVAAQDGRAWVVRDGATRSSPLLDLRSLASTGGERGLLGIAVHPGFPSDPRVFVDYTDRAGDTVVASYRVDPSDPDRLDPGSAEVWLQVDQPYPNHNGGALAFGPDGDLYVSLGDGGSGGDPHGNGQRLDTLLGKILRIAIDVPGDGDPRYGIPTGNPFAGRPDARGEIWLYGLRNPWRMSFDRASGDLWIGDVGQAAWEEVDVARAGVGGLNFGWNRMEGSHCYQPATGCDQDGLVLPVAEYSHDGGGCVVIGGVVYRGTAYPGLRGGYVYSDFCTGTIWALDAGAASPAPGVVGAGADRIAAFGEDEAGEAYAASLDGTIFRVVAGAR